ncbi:reverse transcriptase domain-containing protein [Tanacetum coccineum]|uniref:Reverse transcriptase domain-containing protein n=1 Tax=Tanacetum coccineum TaxID=301880 RepID=A0ABQ4X2K3_9ASTR
MSTNGQTPLSQPTFVVRNTLGKEPVPQDPGRPISNEALWEYCDRNYHQILPIIAEKVHQEKVQQEKLKAVKARLNFEETSHHSESGTPTGRRATQGVGRTTVATGILKAATKVPDQEQRSPPLRDITTKGHPREERRSCQKAKIVPESAAKTKRWKMPTWCHMFNSTLTGNARVWFDDLPKDLIDNYDDIKKAFLENYLQQKKCIKDPVKIHNIRQRDGESTEEFVRRYKLECRDVKGAPECM